MTNRSTDSSQINKSNTATTTHNRRRSLRFPDKVAMCLRGSVGMPLPIEELLVGEHKREGSDSDLSAAQQIF